MDVTFQFGIGMLVVLVAIIVAAGSAVALIFRRMVLRNERREQLHQQH
jgi:hypothetical protein